MKVNIFATTPAAIATAIGGLGLITGLPYAGWIFTAGIAMNLVWLVG